MIVPFIKAGLHDDECYIWITDDPNSDKEAAQVIEETDFRKMLESSIRGAEEPGSWLSQMAGCFRGEHDDKGKDWRRDVLAGNDGEPFE